MNTNAWIAIEDTFPPLYTPVKVSGGADSPDQHGAVHVVARLADAWSASEAEGTDIIVWVDDEYGEELTFDPVHWQAIQVPTMLPA